MWKAVMKVLKQQRGMILGCINLQSVHGICVPTVYLAFGNTILVLFFLEILNFLTMKNQQQMKIPKMTLRRTIKTAKQWITVHLDLPNTLKIFLGYTTMRLNRATNAKLVKCFLRCLVESRSSGLEIVLLKVLQTTHDDTCVNTMKARSTVWQDKDMKVSVACSLK